MKTISQIKFPLSSLTIGFFGLFIAISAEEPQLKPFTSDGCSLFPDGDYWEGGSWCHCCVAHDLKYWKGGPISERKSADLDLKNCVLEATGDEALANAMYLGTRTGGGDFFPTSYRWGYGWPFLSKSDTLSEKAREAQILRWEPKNLDSLIQQICRP